MPEVKRFSPHGVFCAAFMPPEVHPWLNYANFTPGVIALTFLAMPIL